MFAWVISPVTSSDDVPDMLNLLYHRCVAGFNSFFIVCYMASKNFSPLLFDLFAVETTRKCENAVKESDYFRSKHRTALQDIQQLQSDIFDLRSRLNAVTTEKQQLDLEASNVMTAVYINFLSRRLENCFAITVVS